jgi:hypothetical protein
MSGVASCWALAGLSASVVLSTGCASRAVAAHDATNAAAEGIAEEQADPGTPAKNAVGADDTDESRAERHSRQTRRTLGWIGIAIGVEAAAVAVATSFMLLHEKNVLDDNCDAQKACSAPGLNSKAVIQETVPWNTTSWIVAAVGLGGGTILLLTNQTDSGKTTAVTVSPTLAGASFGVRSSF